MKDSKSLNVKKIFLGVLFSLLWVFGSLAYLEYVKKAESDVCARESTAGRETVDLRGMRHYMAKDYVKAFQCYEKAASLGRVASYISVGRMYYEGKGVEQDYVLAREWFEKAAKQGYSDAQFILGRMYYEGKGVARNYVIARQWYEKGASVNPRVQNALGEMYYSGKGGVRNRKKGCALWRMASEKNDASAIEAYERHCSG